MFDFIILCIALFTFIVVVIMSLKRIEREFTATQEITCSEDNYKTIYIYVKETKQIIRISEGTGDNLLDEDIEEGYVDYIYYDQYDMDGCDIQEVDGGQVMLTELFRNKYTCTEGCVYDVFNLAYGSNKFTYIVLD